MHSLLEEGFGPLQILGGVKTGKRSAIIGSAAGGKETVGNGLGIHIGKILSRQVGNQVIAESRQLNMQAASFRLVLEGVNDEVPDKVRLPGHTPGKLPGRAHALSLVREKAGQKLG